MGNAIVQAQPQLTLAEQMQYANTISKGSLVPKAYQGSPANILIAMDFGRSMGLSPAESLYRITVINGKPTASAELIAANVRRAGHKLRVKKDEQARKATVEIVRADDPDYTFSVTWDMAKAQQAQLSGKENWKKYPMAMLTARAITECARDACPEALYGVVYTGEEMEGGFGSGPDGLPGGGAQRSAYAAAAAPADEGAVPGWDPARRVAEPRRRRHAARQRARLPDLRDKGPGTRGVRRRNRRHGRAAAPGVLRGAGGHPGGVRGGGMTAVDGLRPVEELPRRNLGAKKARIQMMLSSFIESGEDLCEVVMDSTGKPLEEGRIEPLRGYMYRIIADGGLPVRTLVRKDADGRRRLYLGKAGK